MRLRNGGMLRRIGLRLLPDSRAVPAVIETCFDCLDCSRTARGSVVEVEGVADQVAELLDLRLVPPRRPLRPVAVSYLECCAHLQRIPPQAVGSMLA